MKVSIPVWQMGGFVFTGILGTFLHFLFDLAGGSLWAGLFSAVNESIWEHMKLLFYPMVLFALVEYGFWGKETPGFWKVKLPGILVGLTLIPVIYYSYTGGAHPNTWQLGWNFDLQTGEFFDPELLAEGTELQEAVTAELIRQAQTPDEDGYVPVEMYWEDYEAIMANWACYAVTFDEAGMNVVFSAYELAPYAAGPQEFHVPYELLEPYLNDTGRLLLSLSDPA